VATRWINKGPTAEGTGNAHGFSANDDGVIIHHNGEMFGVINSDKIWPLDKPGNRPVTGFNSGTNFVTEIAAPVNIQLPPTKLGYKYTLYVGFVGGPHTLTPNAVDKFLMGSKADGIALSGGTAVGDFVTVVGDGKQGWLVTAFKGTWA
jgi:hypothetical protein